MAITYPLTLPAATGIRSVKLIARAKVAVDESEFTFQQQVQAHQGQRWEVTVDLPAMKRAAAEQWAAFLLKLNGREGTFTMGDPAAGVPQGSAAGAPGVPLVKGAAQAGNMLAIDGAPASATGYLKAGDYIQLGSGATTHLHKVLDDANSDALGNVTLTIWPRLRSAPADNAPVVVSAALGMWRMASNAPGWDVDTALIYGISFAAMEAI